MVPSSWTRKGTSVPEHRHAPEVAVGRSASSAITPKNTFTPVDAAQFERETAIKIAEAIYVALHRDMPAPGYVTSADRDAKNLMAAAYAAMFTYEAEKAERERRIRIIEAASDIIEAASDQQG